MYLDEQNYITNDEKKFTCPRSHTQIMCVYIHISTGNWVDSAQDRNYWRALVNAALNLRVS